MDEHLPAGEPPPKSRLALLLVVALAIGLTVVAVFVLQRNNDRVAREATTAGAPSAAAPGAPAVVAEAPPSDAVGAPVPAATGKLYKCKGPGGELSFLDQPCPDGHETVWVRDVGADAAPR
jgi:hypothetical protein